VCVYVCAGEMCGCVCWNTCVCVCVCVCVCMCAVYVSLVMSCLSYLLLDCLFIYFSFVYHYNKLPSFLTSISIIQILRGIEHGHPVSALPLPLSLPLPHPLTVLLLQMIIMKTLGQDSTLLVMVSVIYACVCVDIYLFTT
jgi:hypothetical protein